MRSTALIIRCFLIMFLLFGEDAVTVDAGSARRRRRSCETMAVLDFYKFINRHVRNYSNGDHLLSLPATKLYNTIAPATPSWINILQPSSTAPHQYEMKQIYRRSRLDLEQDYTDEYGEYEMIPCSEKFALTADFDTHGPKIFYQRRSRSRRWSDQTSYTTLRIGIPVNTRFNQFVAVNHDSETGAIKVTGFSVDVFLEAMRLIEDNLVYEFIPFMVANSIGKTAGSYGDLLKELNLGHFDAVVGDTTITTDRCSLVDFTLPYTDLGVGTVARLPQEKQGMWFFLKPMGVDLWMVTTISFVFVGAIVWLIEHQTNEQFQGSVAQQIGTALWFAFSTLVYAHREKLQSNLSRFVVIVWLFIVFILTSCYTATLSSLLTVQQIQLANGDYSTYQTSSSVQGSVVDNLNFDDDRLKFYNSPEEYHEALSKGSKNGGADAIVDEIPYLKAFLAMYPSQYAIVGTSAITNGFGFAFGKGSPLVPKFSRAIAKLREEGRLKQLEKKWFTNSYLSSFTPEDQSEHRLSFHDFRGLFVLSGTSNAITLSIFLFFLVCKKLRENYFILQIFSVRYTRRMMRYMFSRNINTIHDVEMTNVNPQ